MKLTNTEREVLKVELLKDVLKEVLSLEEFEGYEFDWSGLLDFIELEVEYSEIRGIFEVGIKMDDKLRSMIRMEAWERLESFFNIYPYLIRYCSPNGRRLDNLWEFIQSSGFVFELKVLTNVYLKNMKMIPNLYLSYEAIDDLSCNTKVYDVFCLGNSSGEDIVKVFPTKFRKLDDFVLEYNRLTIFGKKIGKASEIKYKDIVLLNDEEIKIVQSITLDYDNVLNCFLKKLVASQYVCSFLTVDEVRHILEVGSFNNG